MSKKWESVREEAVKKFLGGSKAAERQVYQVIDKERFSLSFVSVVMTEYPSDEVTVNPDLTIEEDLKFLSTIRRRMAVRMAKMAKCRVSAVGIKDLERFILEWIICNWSEILSDYRALLEKKLKFLI